MPGKKWRVFNFVVEVAVESPKHVPEEEAAEDACEFAVAMSRTMGRVHESFVSVTRVDEYGYKTPPGGGVVIKRGYPTGEKAELTLPRGVEKNADYAKLMKKKPVKAKPKTPKSKKKKATRY